MDARHHPAGVTAGRQSGRAPITRSWKPATWSLRRRAAVAAAVGALVVAGALSFATYFLVRNYVVDQRVSSATRQALANARLLRDRLAVGGETSGVLVESVRTDTGAVALLRRSGEWFSSSVGAGPNLLPPSVESAVESQVPGRQRSRSTGSPVLYVVVPMPSVDATYVEVFPMQAAEDLLQRLRNTLLAGAALAGLAGASLGAWSSRRALRPLESVGRVARAVADGDLGQRIEPASDPDLDDFGSAFNRMTDELTDRIDREARFASDVSHELRTPLTALSLAAATLDRRRDELPERSRHALDIVLGGVTDLQRLVEELLELAHLDAGTEPGRLADTTSGATIEATVAQSLAKRDGTPAPLHVVSPQVASRPFGSGQRLERIVANLAENADRYAEGLVAVTIGGDDRTVELWFDDAGPGIAPGDRDRLFERFSRGDSTQHIPGSGLGLSIVTEHVRQLGGSVEILDRPGGGCRFVVTFPVPS